MMNEFQPERDKEEVLLPLPKTFSWEDIRFDEQKSKWVYDKPQCLTDDILRFDDCLPNVQPNVSGLWNDLESLPLAWWEVLDRVKAKAEAEKKFR